MTTSEMNEAAQTARTAGGSPRVSRTAAAAVASSERLDRKARSAELRRSPYPPVLGHVIQRAARVVVAGWDRAIVDVQRVQERQLTDLIAHAKDTEFGRAHGFASIRNYDDFVKRVPIGDYDAFSPFIDRMRKAAPTRAAPSSCPSPTGRFATSKRPGPTWSCGTWTGRATPP
jgi:hypothetical protein